MLKAQLNDVIDFLHPVQCMIFHFRMRVSGWQNHHLIHTAFACTADTHVKMYREERSESPIVQESIPSAPMLWETLT